MNQMISTACLGLLVFAGHTMAADQTDTPADAAPASLDSPLTLNIAAAYAEPPTGDAQATNASEGSPIKASSQAGWGRADDRWWITLGAGVAHDLHEDTDYNAHVAFSTFLATELEFAVELGAWYFAQEGQDTGGLNPNMVFRWHLLHDDHFNWTIFGDVGIGLLFSFDDVPTGGTSFGFTPRAGAGFTHRLGDGETRLQVGFRYHHISNGRFQGDAQNPSRDSIMLYAGVIFPF